MKFFTIVCLLTTTTLSCGSLLADDILVGLDSRYVKNVAADQTEPDTTNLRVGERSEFIKVGGGLWKLPLSLIDQPWPFELKVGDGTVELVEGTPVVPSKIDPPSVLQDAQIWLEADDTNRFVTTTSHGSEADKTYVDQWLDYREDLTQETRSYPYAKAFYKGSMNIGEFNTAPEISSHNGQPTIYFGGALSGRSMDFCFPNGTLFSDLSSSTTDYFKFGGVTTKRQRVRSLFIVHAIVDAQGWLVGATKDLSNSYSLHWGRYSTTDLARQIMGDFHGNEYGYQITGGYAQNRNTWRNGEFVDFRSINCSKGAFLYEVETTAEAFVAEALMSERHHYISKTDIRDGGDHVMAYIAFARDISPEERLQVRDYLMRKYLADQWQRAEMRVDVAESAQVRFSGDIKLTGDGTAVKVGEGDAVVKTDAAHDNFEGAIELQSGRIVLKETIPVKPTAAGVSFSATSSVQSEGIVVAKQDAEPGVVEKTGAAQLDFAEVPDDAAELKVAEGVLGLVPRIRSDEKRLTTEPATVAIRNSGFEDDTGWSFSGGSHAFVKPPNSAWSFMDKPPEGDRIVRITLNCTMSQDVTIPVAGTYELSAYTRTRAEGGHVVDVLLVEKATGKQIRFARTSSPTPSGSGIGYVRAYHRATIPNAGVWTLKFVGLFAEDRTTVYDDVRLVQVEDDPDSLWRIPGGDFEVVEYNHDNRPAAAGWSRQVGARWFNISNRVENWEFEAGAYADDSVNFDAGLIFPAVGVVQSATLHPNGSTGFWWGYNGGASSSEFFVNQEPRRHGLGELLFTTNGASATVVCTPPAGTWQVQADLINGYNSYTGTGFANVPKVEIYANDQYLGHIYATDAIGRNFRTCKSPRAFTCDGQTSVTIRLKSSDVKAGYRGCTLDNIALTKNYGVWLENPSFCLGTRAVATPAGYRHVAIGWDANWPAKGVVSIEDATLNEKNWGLDTWDNGKLVSLCGLGGISQVVHFPVAGTYVATIPCRNRRDNVDCQQVVDVNLIQGDETNTVGNVRINSLTYQRHRVLFQVANAGDYRFELKGTLNGYGSALIDLPRIDFLSSERLTQPACPETLVVRVAKNATLKLDYAGTNKVARYVYDGKRHFGVLTAANCPGLAGGGALEVPRKGFCVIVR